jgi:hypothetical protein
VDGDGEGLFRMACEHILKVLSSKTNTPVPARPGEDVDEASEPLTQSVGRAGRTVRKGAGRRSGFPGVG